MARTLSDLLGGSKELALFEAFALRKRVPLTATDVCNYSGVSWATVHRRLEDWQALGVVHVVGKEGKALKYQLNLQSPGVRALTRAVNLALREMLEDEMLQEGVPESEMVSAPKLVSIKAGEHFEWGDRLRAKPKLIAGLTPNMFRLSYGVEAF